MPITIYQAQGFLTHKIQKHECQEIVTWFSAIARKGEDRVEGK